ncbi:MAG: hypothetical protein OEY34_07370, partial [Cyclobacteriaceae bacterium]|nr:hypothetical protein [Cyclobacteriaceae bacterium]
MNSSLIALFFSITTFYVDNKNQTSSSDGFNERVYDITQLYFYADSTRTLSFKDITQDAFSKSFIKNPHFRPTDYQTKSNYWIRFHFTIPENNTNYLIEFYDQTIDSLELYYRLEGDSLYHKEMIGDHYSF